MHFKNCMDHKCSIQCRHNWARRQSWIVKARLKQDNGSIYFGTFRLLGDITPATYRNIRHKLGRLLKQANIEYYGVAEIDDRKTTLHHHFIFISPEANKVAAIKAVLRLAAGELDCICKVDVVGMTDRDKARVAGYIVKDGDMYSPPLFARSAIPISFQSRGFFGTTKAKFERELLDKWREEKTDISRPVNELLPSGLSNTFYMQGAL
ncbi:MAG: hypothetical protein NTW19_08975 [Planctomycetota bacterium]|nr:hypothetical protein [Planctomycetota bacterium]